MLENKYVRRGICKVIGFSPLLLPSTRAATATSAVISPQATVYVATVTTVVPTGAWG